MKKEIVVKGSAIVFDMETLKCSNVTINESAEYSADSIPQFNSAKNWALCEVRCLGASKESVEKALYIATQGGTGVITGSKKKGHREATCLVTVEIREQRQSLPSDIF